MISLIVARARGGAIGKDNLIPWHSPQDLRMFQRETMGGAVIMGRRTWESLPFKPLKNRMNIVVSRDVTLTGDVVPSVAAGIAACAADYGRIYGIGGQAIYREMLPLADRMLITEVDLQVEGADAFFPEFDALEWHELPPRPLTGEGPRCVLRELIRRR